MELLTTQRFNGKVTFVTLLKRKGDVDDPSDYVLDAVFVYEDGHTSRLRVTSCNCCGGADWVIEEEDHA